MVLEYLSNYIALLFTLYADKISQNVIFLITLVIIRQIIILLYIQSILLSIHITAFTYPQKLLFI